MGSTFDPEAVGIEKQMLKKALEDEVNDKRLYCQRQANREFFGDSPAGVRQEGYLEEVDGLTPEALTEAYYEMLRTANIELIILGCDEASTTAVKDALLAELSAIDRAPLPRAENIAMPRREPVRKVEHFDTTQAKLCMLFTLGRPMQPEQLAAVRLAMALYGGSVTSRLFLNVRERDHLCYYCSSSFQSFTGSMAVNSGVEHADAARAEQAVLKELADLRDGPITDEELEDCRRGLLAGMNGLEDTLGGIETWYYMEVLRGGPVQTPDDARRALLAVTREDVRDILKQFTLSVSCLLTREEGKREMAENTQSVLERTAADQWKVLPSGLTVLVRPMPGYSGTHVIYATRFGSIDRDFRLGERECICPPVWPISSSTRCSRMRTAMPLQSSPRPARMPTPSRPSTAPATSLRPRNSWTRALTCCWAWWGIPTLPSRPSPKSRASSGRR